ncbi:androglobin-like isoform X2 [Diabrotica undecimpunctata]|uniref:androglobin-like isoform X2 n=1 Tax=Diabrotica undecimpunctata TaxID=50387 RepID=UPI003B633D5B
MSSGTKAAKLKDSHIQLESPIADLCSRLYEAEASDDVPFPEFLDIEINSEKWDSPGHTSTAISSVDKKGSAMQLIPYDDQRIIYLPPSLHAQEWRKLDEVFMDAHLVIKNETGKYPDLRTGSSHLLHSEFVRSFISSIETLFYLGNEKQFSVEYTSPSFNPSFEKEPWRPWNHIYCNCKSGKSYPHTPTSNPVGKYVVRLYWMGSWRKIYISDKIPINQHNEIMLPSCPISLPTSVIVEDIEPQSTSKQKDEKTSKSQLSKQEIRKRKEKPEKKTDRVIEIWPFLLSKALMILAGLTWTEEEELSDFDIIHCLTGWIPNKIYTTDLDSLAIWQLCLDHTHQYTWFNSDISEKPSKKGFIVSGRSSKLSVKSEKSNKSISYKSAKSETRSDTMTDKSEKDKKSLKKEKTGIKKKEALQRTPQPEEKEVNKDSFILTIGIALNSELNKGWSHTLLVPQTRTVPLLKPTKDEEHEPWKRYRWIDWAIKEKIVNPRAPVNPIKSFLTVDPFRDKYSFMVQKDHSLDTDVVPETKKTDHLPKSKRVKTTFAYEDITEWLDFENIYQSLQLISIYYRGSSFNVKTRVSNISSENIKKETRYPFAKKLEQLHGMEWKEIIYPVVLQKSRNEPIYLFCDSLFKQSVVINLSQTINDSIFIEKQKEAVIRVVEPEEVECGSCPTTFLERIKKNMEPEKTVKSDVYKKVQAYSKRDIPESSIVISKFSWCSQKVNDYVGQVSTTGTSSFVLNLNAGQHVLMIWIQTNGSYCLQFFSNTYLCIGNLEETLTLMNNDPLLFKYAYCKFTEDLQNLIYSFGIKDEFLGALRDFYRSYKPQENLCKKDINLIHDLFLKEFFEILTTRFGPETLKSVKILLRKWQFDDSCRCVVRDPSIFCYSLSKEENKYVEIMNKNVTKIQAFFRGVYERIMTSHHDTKSKRFSATTEILYKVCEKFDEHNKILGAYTLCKFIENPDMKQFQQHYAWYEDKLKKLCIVQYSHTINVEKGWNLITRQSFLVRSGPPIKIRIHVFCDMDQYVVRVFDNDTSKEMANYLNNVIVNEYKSNNYGYTLVAYGTSETSKTVTYKVMYACQQGGTEEMIYLTNVISKKIVFNDYYIPNHNNYIGRYTVKVKSDSRITLHLFSSYPGVKIFLKVSNLSQPNQVVIETSASSSVTIPLILLKSNSGGQKLGNFLDSKLIFMSNSDSTQVTTKKVSKRADSKNSHLSSKGKPTVIQKKPSGLPKLSIDDNNEMTYIIEAFVLDNSWPLTYKEWQTVEMERIRRMEIESLFPDRTESLDKYSSEMKMPVKIDYGILKSRRSLKSPNSPSSTLILHCGDYDDVKITINTDKEDSLMRTKMACYENDPYRYNTAKTLRKEFLEENLILNDNIITNHEARTINRKDFEEYIVPLIDITQYSKTNLSQQGFTVVKSTEDVKQDIQKILTAVSVYSESELTNEAKSMEQFTDEHIANLETFNNWFKDIQQDSVWMMNQVYKERFEFLQNIRDIVRPKCKGKKGITNKKKKK